MLDTNVLADVARQVFEGLKTVTAPTGIARVTLTSKQGLRKVEFTAGDVRLVGIQQNPSTASRWARLAREGHQVMQFRDARTGAYVAVVVDGKVTLYHRQEPES